VFKIRQEGIPDLMPLSWSNSAAIVEALQREHPETERLSLNRDHLLQMILALPEFGDRHIPPLPACLDHILWTWMRLADDLPEEKERRRI
jgi:FeS assembly protein IscX